MKLNRLTALVEEMKKANDFFIAKNRIYQMTTPGTYNLVPIQDEPLWVTRNIPYSYKDDVDESDITKIVKKLKRDPQLQKDLEKELARSEHYLNLKNGVFDLDSKQLKSRGNLIFTYQLDFEYIPDSKIQDAPALESYLQTSLDYPKCPEKA